MQYERATVSGPGVVSKTLGERDYGSCVGLRRRG
jgi:hypothetical protein